MDVWGEVLLFNKKYYKHYPSYFTTVYASAEKEAAKFKKMGFDVKIVTKRIKEGSGKKTRTVCSLYLRQAKDVI
jgi:hypothetical protein